MALPVPAQSRPPVRRRVVAPSRDAVLAVLGYLLVRAVGVAVLAWWAGERSVRVTELLATRSDAGWYLGIARDGYDAGVGTSNLAFFPLYPALVRAVALVVGWDALPGVIVSTLAGAVAAAGLFAVGRAVHGPRTGVVLAVLWGTLPHAVVESMGYSETLFTALAAWCLYALVRRHWLTAAVLCLAAGLTRPVALALVPVVVVDALVAVVRERRPWRPALAALVAPLGLLGYLGWVARRTGRLDGWSHVQREGWRSAWDWGRDTVDRAGEVLTGEQPLVLTVVTLVLVLAVLLLAVALVTRGPGRLPWQLLAFAALGVVLTLGSGGYYHSKARFLLTAFPLLLVVARPLAAAQRAQRYLVLAVAAAASGWFGGYLMLVWTWSP